MKALQTIIAVATLLHAANTFAQTEEAEDATSYKAEVFGSASSGSTTPFWMVSNRYGVVPLDANNGYLNAGVFHQQHFGKGFRWSAGLDIVAVVPRYRNVYIQQIYAELGYKSMLLSVGSKENRHSLWDHSLSSGDMVLSSNARPIPEIKLSMPEFTVVPLTKGWMQVKGDFAVGKSFDTKYLENFSNGKQTYIKNVLWHHKSFYVRIKDTQNKFPLSGIIGVQHWAQWGGTSSNPRIGVQPHCYDKSGMEFKNGTDGLWGAQLDLPRLPWLKKVVTEYLVTRNQSGPFHFIIFDHDKYQGPGGGGDDYYNNIEYITGSSYFGQGIGSPLLTSPQYNTNGDIDFKNTRVRAWHLAFEGDLSPMVSYRLRYTLMNSWGKPYAPFLDNKRSNSGQVEVKYHHPRLQGWEFTGAVAADAGSLYGDNVGFSLSVCKRGILKSWK